MIVQSVSEYGTTDISFTIHENDLDLAKKLLAPIVAELRAAQLIAKSGVAKLSVVGIGIAFAVGRGRENFFDCLAAAELIFS
jgi:aspartate kinase